MTSRFRQQLRPSLLRPMTAAATAVTALLVLSPALATPPIEPEVSLPAVTVTETTSSLVVYYYEGADRASKSVGVSLPAGPITIGGNKGQPGTSVEVSRDNQLSLTGSAFTEAVKVSLPSEMTVSAARAYAAEIERDPGVRAVLIDRQVARHGIYSDDPLAYVLWNLEGPDAGTTHTEPVWTNGQGSGVTVAVLDTGMVDHPDMQNAWTGGYDFITDPALAGDSDGRDADPTDAMSCDNGSGVTAANPHGLMVGSVIAARLNNTEGMAGVAPAASILPVRVISGCGGLLSDVLDGMRWAVGLPVTGLPVNPTPAKVLNLSLGTTSPGAVCSNTVQSIIDEVRGTGATIIVSTGNDGADAISVPAACQGVIAVTASTKDGKRADYGNAGVGTSLAAAGGGCAPGAIASCATTSSNYIAVATHNGTAAGYVMSAGTSFSAPHVSGAAALLLERNGSRTPDQILSILVNSARPFASGDCPGDICGAGMLDVNDALAATGFSLSATIDSAAVRAEDSVRMTAQASSDAVSPVYTWRQLTGQSVVLDVASDGRSATFIAPAAEQSLSFEVKAVETSGSERVAVVSTRVTVAPELNPVDTIRVNPGVEVRHSFILTKGGAPEAVGIDSAAVAKGITVENNQVVWANPEIGDHTVQVTPYDAIGSGIPTTVTIEVKDQSQDSSATDGSGGGGALGLHGALLLMLAWIARRRLYAG